MMTAPLPAEAASTVYAATSRAAAADVFYPCSDGRPMAENMWQSRAILNTVGDIESVHPGALVAADILVYPEKGNADNKIAPDVLVAFGIGTASRRVYQVWAEGKPPDWVLEVASPGTEANDRGYKRDYFAAMRVPEYWLFDPKGGVYPRGTPRLQGLGLKGGEYRPLDSRLVGGERLIRSEVLGLDVRGEGELLRFRDPATGRDVPHRPEVEAAAKQAQAVAERAAAQASREAVQRKTAEARAEREAGRAEREAARAGREAAARSAAEARIAELEATLRRARSTTP